MVKNGFKEVVWFSFELFLFCSIVILVWIKICMGFDGRVGRGVGVCNILSLKWFFMLLKV